VNGAASAVIAVVFDFDDTLVPDSTTALLAAHEIDPNRFWKIETKERIRAGFDPTLAYLTLLLERVGPDKPLGRLTNAALREFGKTLDRKLYPGLRGLIRDLRSLADKHEEVVVEFYIISGGLREVILGSEFVRKHFKAVYGCELSEGPSGVLQFIKRAVNFTEKTRYLFEINKGLDQARTSKNPYLVNEDISPEKRRVPFKNIIYVGDGLTDIPCFSLVKKMGGTPIGVFDPGDEGSAKRALLKFLKTERVISSHAARFGKKDELGALLRAAVGTLLARIQVDRGAAQPGI